MNYQQTLDYLYDTLPMFTRIGSAAFKKDLTNIRALCTHLGDPHLQFKSIHVGGTNGKGSVSHMLAAVFQKAGYKTGLHTSPHLYDFRERIRINGGMVPEDFIVSFTETNVPLIETLQPSFFEFSVAMAFAYFAQERVDIAIVEVGLGGRLDSTNILLPELSVITNIGLDHVNMLGNTHEAIAREKAGIIKPNTPVVIGESLPETRIVFDETAAAQQAPITYADSLMTPVEHETEDGHLHVSYKRPGGGFISLSTDLPGLYQIKNLRTVLAALRALKVGRWHLKAEDINAALANVKNLTGLQGRWELIHKKPGVILEVAHNAGGIRELIEHLKELRYRQLHIVFGMVNDKEPEPLLSLLPKKANYYFTQASIPRALDKEELKEKAAAFSLNGDAYSPPDAALRAAMKAAQEEDLIVVCGSIFVVAEIDKASIIDNA